MSRPIRPSANQTRARILKFAKKHFLEKGFDATYIKDIADSAQVNTNLIFHHFVNKKTLWRKVKSSILTQKIEPLHSDFSSAKEFFKNALAYRFEVYNQYPDLVKLIQWQQITKNSTELSGSDFISPSIWLNIIQRFQEIGEIKKDIPAEQILLFIIFSSYAPFLQETISMDKEQKDQYKNMLIKICYTQFVCL